MRRILTIIVLVAAAGVAAPLYFAVTPDSHFVVLDRTGDTLALGTMSRHPLTVDTASTATPTPNCDACDQYDLTALAAGATFAFPAGTPVNGQKLIIRILDNGGAQTLAWNSGAGGYISRGATLPTTTVISKYLYVGLIYNSTAGKWDCVAVVNE